MQKWGKDARGKQRFRCNNCAAGVTGKRHDLTLKYRQAMFQKWLLGKLSLTEISHKYGVTRQTLQKWFTPFWDDEPTPQAVELGGAVVVIDGKYLAKKLMVLVAHSNNRVIDWRFVERENYENWRVFFLGFEGDLLAIVCDGQRGMLKAIREVFPQAIIQRCQFHVMKYCLAKLTKNPQSTPAYELRSLVMQISKIKTKQSLKEWLTLYLLWRKTHNDYLKEKTFQEYSLTPTGRKRWHYTHGKLHATHSHLANALPNLFQHLRCSQISNTTNFVEGGINSPMQTVIRSHRGLDLQKRRVLVAHYLSSKQ